MKTFSQIAIVSGVLVCLSLLNSSLCFCQSPPSSCPPDDGCGPWQGPFDKAFYSTQEPTCIMWAQYKQRLCNGVWEFVIENMKFQGSCDVFESLQIEQYNYNSAAELLVHGFLETMLSGSTPSTVYDCDPNDPNPPATPRRAIVYTASCGIWVGCEYDIVPGTRKCDNGFDEPFPDASNKVKAWKYQSCGTTCCRREFAYCYKPGLQNPNKSVLTAVQVSKTQLTPCSEESNYDTPCQSGC